MKYSNIYKRSVSDGTGIRVSLYVSGCRVHCPGCHNPEAQDFEYGKDFTVATINEIVAALLPDYVAGLTLCGGEPMEPENQKELLKLVKVVKTHLPQKNIWCYTGYEFADLLSDGKQHTEITDELLKYIDILVVGPYVEANRDITKRNLWRGSTNQRVINVAESLASGKPVPVETVPNNKID